MGHCKRMPVERPMKEVLDWEPPGIREQMAEDAHEEMVVLRESIEPTHPGSVFRNQ